MRTFALQIMVAPAETMGMKFPSWREPKPLRPSRPSTAIDNQGSTPILRPHSYVPGEKNLLSRLSKPTTATKLKTIEFNRRINFIDTIKYFSWSNMKLYQDQTRLFYTRNGGLRGSVKPSSLSTSVTKRKQFILFLYKSRDTAIIHTMLFENGANDNSSVQTIGFFKLLF